MKKSRKNILKEKAHINVAKNLFLSILLSESGNTSEYVANADSKHSKILGEVRLLDIDYYNIRNWSGQSDLGAPPQLSLESLNGQGKYSWIKWIKQFLQDIRYFTWQGFYDDISLLQSLDFMPILAKCTVEDVLGFSPFSRHRISGYSFTVNERWLRYIYFCGVIESCKLLDSSSPTWVDVGPFYGGLQYVVNTYFDLPLSNVLVDFDHQLCRSFVLLSYHFPDHKHYYFVGSNSFLDIHTGVKHLFSAIPKKSFVYCPAHLFKVLDQCLQVSPTLFTNFFSLGEMNAYHFNEYLSSSMFNNSSFKYLVNRFESSPFFEPTYDNKTTLLDYLNYIPKSRISHFRVCPVHHYNIPSRTLNRRFGPRPVSSNYFELIST